MKFGQFMSYYKRKKNYQNFLQKLPPENSFQALLVFAKNKAQCPKLLKQATYICISKTIRIYPNKHNDLQTFLFTEDFLKIEKDLKLVSRPHFS